ncbi:MAG: hypothetical protein RIQ60_275 [Pseudomonadota bacterium]|jgi:hypothetical protein
MDGRRRSSSAAGSDAAATPPALDAAQAVVPPEAVLYPAASALDGAPQRHIRHPGRPDTTPDVLPCRLRRVLLAGGELPTGLPLIEALDQALTARGVTSAVLRLPEEPTGSAFLRLDPYPYVLPALSRDPAHAVYFSERHQAPGAVQVQAGAITFGRRGDQPWLHGHLDWMDLDAAGRPLPDQRGCGHVLPNEAVVVHAAGCQPIEVWALEGAAFEVVPDEFTRFSLFKPQAVDAPSAASAHDEDSRPALAMRVPPNVDLCLTLEAVCRERGIRSATLRGGVGSTVGVVFDDGPAGLRTVEPFVTETLVNQGRVVSDAATGELRAEIDVTLIDYLGGRHQGHLARGRNPVLVTFELVLEITAAAGAG